MRADVCGVTRFVGLFGYVWVFARLIGDVWDYVATFGICGDPRGGVGTFGDVWGYVEMRADMLGCAGACCDERGFAWTRAVVCVYELGRLARSESSGDTWWFSRSVRARGDGRRSAGICGMVGAALGIFGVCWGFGDV